MTSGKRRLRLLVGLGQCLLGVATFAHNHPAHITDENEQQQRGIEPRESILANAWDKRVVTEGEKEQCHENAQRNVASAHVASYRERENGGGDSQYEQNVADVGAHHIAYGHVAMSCDSRRHRDEQLRGRRTHAHHCEPDDEIGYTRALSDGHR